MTSVNIPRRHNPSFADLIPVLRTTFSGAGTFICFSDLDFPANVNNLLSALLSLHLFFKVDNHDIVVDHLLAKTACAHQLGILVVFRMEELAFWFSKYQIRL